MSYKGQKFSKEFKEEAVAHWQNSDKTAQEVAENLGILSEKYLSRWKRELSQKGSDTFPGHCKLLGKGTEQERDIFKKTNDLIYHSDRGSQYASNDFRKLLKTLGVKQSMSRRANCWDNACAESFLHL